MRKGSEKTSNDDFFYSGNEYMTWIMTFTVKTS